MTCVVLDETEYMQLTCALSEANKENARLEVENRNLKLENEDLKNKLTNNEFELKEIKDHHYGAYIYNGD